MRSHRCHVAAMLNFRYESIDMKFRILRASFAILLVAANMPQVLAAPVEFDYQATDTTVSSRGVAIPVTFTHPLTSADESFPLVVMAHGHGGTRNEAGGYTSVAEGLAARGIASIRMDFPGCGDSTESFAKNNLSNMIADIQASRDFAVMQPGIDADRVGLLGFSMGGRMVLLLSAMDTSYKAIATWAPAGANELDTEFEFVGGPDEYRRLREQAHAEGFAPFTTQWGQDQLLGPEWFTDLEEARPLDAIRNFTGPLLVLYGDLDDVVLPRVSESVIEAATMSSEVVRHIVVGAGHGLGLFNDRPDLTDEAVKVTVDFLGQRL